jgi:hypothetical protein
MAENILDVLGISEEDFNKAKDSTVTKLVEALESGVYPATVQSAILYKAKFQDSGEVVTTLRVEVKLDESGKVVTFKKDIGKTLKDKTINEGFVTRLKSLCHATNVDIDKLKLGEAVKVNSYGKEYDGQYLVGMNGKPVLAMVRKMNDLNKDENDGYKYTNELEGVTVKGSEDIEVFEEKAAKVNGVFTFKGYVKPEGSKAAGSETVKQSLKEMDF